MTFISIGDLAQSLQLRRQNTALKTQMNTLTQELASGQHADLSRHLNGNMRILAGIDSSLSSLDAFQRIATHAERHLQDTQSSLDVVQNVADAASADFLTVTNVQDPALLDSASANAETKLATALSALNTQSAGQSIFAGNATDQPALIDAETMLTTLKTELAGASSVGDVTAVLNDWFDTPGGGFDTVAYLGSDEPLNALKVGQDRSVDVSTTATDPAIKTVLKGLAAAALIQFDIPSGTLENKSSLAQYSSEILLSSASSISTLRGAIGLEQSIASEAETQNGAHISTLEIGRNEITLADPYDTATQLENTRNQLETLFAVTARLSQLKLADFLR